jgi:hypothetical protein
MYVSISASKIERSFFNQQGDMLIFLECGIFFPTKGGGKPAFGLYAAFFR